MKRLLVLALTIMLAMPPIAVAHARSPHWIPPQAVCAMLDHKTQAKIAECLTGKRMSKEFRNCLIFGGLTAAGVAVGGVIGGAAARAIAGSMIGAGSFSCLSAIIRS